MRLAELPLTDLTVPLPLSRGPARCRGLDGPGSAPLPEACHQDMADLLMVVEEARQGRDEYAVNHDGERWRVTWGSSIEGGRVMLRRGANPVPAFTALGLEPVLVNELLSLGTRSGLVVFCGEIRSGKTTVASSFVKEVAERTGVEAITIEQPAELVIEGTHGQGVVYQEIFDDMGAAMARAMRSGSRVMFVGEIRRSMEASLALTAACNGALVPMTVHGSDPAAALLRLVKLAAPEDGEYARAALAEGLAACVHLRLREGIGGHRLVEATAAIVTAREGSCPVRSLLRAGKFEQLPAVAAQQAARRRDGEFGAPQQLRRLR